MKEDEHIREKHENPVVGKKKKKPHTDRQTHKEPRDWIGRARRNDLRKVEGFESGELTGSRVHPEEPKI